MSIVTPITTEASRRLGLGRNGHAKEANELLISGRKTGSFAESFRLLAANVELLMSESPSRAVVIVSPHAGDGRSLVAANLAIALAERQRVLLIEERQRSLSRLFRAGISNERDGIPAALRRSVTETNQAGVYLMQWADPALDGHGEVGRAIDSAADAGMFTIIDSPPAALSSDPFLMAQRTGHALCVVRRRSADLELHRQIKAQIERLNANVIGLVVNEF